MSDIFLFLIPIFSYDIGVTPAVTLTIEELLARAGGNYNPNLIPRMRRRYGSLVTQALLEQNSTVARDAYEQTEILQQTETEIDLRVDGYTVNGNFNAGNDAFIILHKGWNCYLLKSMTDKESARATNLLRSIEDLKERNPNLAIPNLTNFELRQIRNKHFMIMPHYTNTIEILSTITLEAGIDLYNQIALALEFLHGVHKPHNGMPEHYNHMDIKPSNICTAGNGQLVLIDLGSVVKLGEKSESTRVYVPRDFQPRSRENPTSNAYVAWKSNDWWMLAMTIAEKVYNLPVGHGATPPPLMSELKIMLSDEAWADLTAKLNDD